MYSSVIDRLCHNGMEAWFVNTKEEVLPLLQSLLPAGATVGLGGSQTLAECGVIDYLHSADIKLIDRYEPGITRQEMESRFVAALSSDVFITSTNAITQAGELYNVDGTGNRVAAMIYGPKSVIVVAGVNKIVPDIAAAVKRVKTVAAPKNSQRLQFNTYCSKAGVCANEGFGCDSDEKICCSYVVLGKQRVKNRIKVILVGEELGF